MACIRSYAVERACDVAPMCQGCGFQLFCQREPMACAAFYRWVHGDNVTPHRTPSRYWWDAVEAEDDAERAQKRHQALAHQLTQRLAA